MYLLDFFFSCFCKSLLPLPNAFTLKSAICSSTSSGSVGIQVMNHERDMFVLIIYWLLKGCKPNRASLKKTSDLISRELEMKFNVQTNKGR